MPSNSKPNWESLGSRGFLILVVFCLVWAWPAAQNTIIQKVSRGELDGMVECFSGDLYSSLQVAVFDNKSVRPATCDDLSWPAAFLLASYHRSHRHCSKTLPRWSDITSSVRQLGRKVLWRGHFGESKGELVCAPKHATALYSLTAPPPEHRQWLSCLLSNLRQCFNRAVHSARCSPK